MNVDMLRYLVELSAGKIDAIESDSFFFRFPRNSSTYKDLELLKNLGFISLLDSDDEISVIGVNKKACDYFK